MGRIAIFVDAGYLFAQGSAALTGEKKPRRRVTLNQEAVLDELREVARARAEACTLLRVYWYDGAKSTGPSLEQTLLASMDDVKVRLGFINKQGQQKGVDSLVVTDLVELGRNRAISDALLLSGDEDVRIGVQLAQSFGVRVHLLGIAPSRGSQSEQLRHEADTNTEWDAKCVEGFLTIAEAEGEALPKSRAKSVTHSTNADLEKIAQELARSLKDETRKPLMAAFSESTRIPPEIDGRLLGMARDEIGKVLDESEKRYLRDKFREAVNKTQ